MLAVEGNSKAHAEVNMQASVLTWITLSAYPTFIVGRFGWAAGSTSPSNFKVDHFSILAGSLDQHW